MNQSDIELHRRFKKSPLYFIEKIWKLVPQPMKAEYLDSDWTVETLRENMFETFEKGRHLTWQQWQFLLCIEDAVNGRGLRRIAIESGQGCHAKDTEIIMFDGTIKKVQDIEVGELLMGDDSTPRRVLRLNRGREQMYRVQYSTGDYYDVNGSHILSLVASTTHGTIKKGDLFDVSVEEFLSWSERKRLHTMGYKAQMELPEKRLPIDPYLFGLWLGDGTSANGDITNPDREIIDYLFTIGATQKKTPNRCSTFKVHGLSAKLKELGVKCGKYIPDIYLRASIQQRRALLAGLLDTDGYLDRSSFEIMQKNEQIAKGILWLARSCGHRAQIKKVQKTCTNSSNGRVMGDYFRVLISSKLWLIPTRVSRKQYKKLGNEQRNALNYCISIEPLEVDDYYGFTVDDNHRYLMGDFTVTHNCGKTAVLAMVIIWFLFTHKDARVPCTAPTAEQMYDALWREVYLWLDKMPKPLKELFEWSSDMLKVKDRPETWFARARTARKERPEALAGIHGKHLLVIVDEASGVDDEIFRIAEGLLTGDNVIFIMISQHQRLLGYFHRAFTTEKNVYRLLRFSAIESPIVNTDFVDRIKSAYGEDSDAYRIQVLGMPPLEDSIDEKGYVPLLTDLDIRIVQDLPFTGRTKLGVDPSGEGEDTTEWVGRDTLKAKCLASEKVSNSVSIASKTLGLMDKYKVEGNDTVLDNFGEGANVGMEIARAGRYIKPINVGDEADDPDRFLNKRAELSWRAREWLKRGGELSGPHAEQLKAEALLIKYRYGTRGKIQIMSKDDMRKIGIKSPNKWDAFTLTFNQKDMPLTKKSSVDSTLTKDEMFSAI